MTCYLDEPNVFIKTIEENLDKKNKIANEFFVKFRDGLRNKSSVVIIREKANGTSLRQEGKLFDVTVDIMGDRTFGLLIFEVMCKNGLDYPRIKFIININLIKSDEENNYSFTVGEEKITIKL